MKELPKRFAKKAQPDDPAGPNLKYCNLANLCVLFKSALNRIYKVGSHDNRKVRKKTLWQKHILLATTLSTKNLCQNMRNCLRLSKPVVTVHGRLP